MSGSLISERSLPPELWIQILARLPVKTLVKLRCVSKSWRSIIDGPYFISTNIALSNNNRKKVRLLSFEYLNELRLTTHDVDTFLQTNDLLWSSKGCPNAHVYGYVNGLMLVRLHVYPKSHIPELRFHQQELVLWNPSIRKSLKLPKCPVFALSTSVVLLGFDPSSYDYKVAVLNHKQPLAVIYDLSKGSWRTKAIENVFDVDFYGTQRGVFCNGAAHWIPFRNSKIFASFDFGSETLSYSDFPMSGGDCRPPLLIRLLLVGGSLALYVHDCNKKCCIWVKGNEDQNQLWTKRFSWDWNFEWNSLCYSICYVERRDMFFLNTYKKLWYLHAKSNKMEAEHNSSRSKDFGLFLDTYVESLVLANASSISQSVRFLD